MDSFFGIGIPELFMIAIIALVVLGPERLPATLREVAKFIKNVRAMINELTSQFGDEFKALEELNPQKLLRELTNDPDKTADALAKTLGTTASKPAATTPAAVATTPSTTTKTSSPTPSTAQTIGATTTVTPPTSAGVASAEAPSEVKKAVDAPTTPAVEPSILPPAPSDSVAMPSIEVHEAEPIASASIIDDGPIVEEDASPSEPSASVTERLADSAVDTLPENSAPEMTSPEISDEDIEAADIITVDASTVEAASVENVNTGAVDAGSGNTNGSEKAAGEVPVVPTRAYTQSASVNGAHVNGNSKENEA